jgi:hypothetical protein
VAYVWQVIGKMCNFEVLEEMSTDEGDYIPNSQ